MGVVCVASRADLEGESECGPRGSSEAAGPEVEFHVDHAKCGRIARPGGKPANSQAARRYLEAALHAVRQGLAGFQDAAAESASSLRVRRVGASRCGVV